MGIVGLEKLGVPCHSFKIDFTAAESDPRNLSGFQGSDGLMILVIQRVDASSLRRFQARTPDCKTIPQSNGCQQSQLNAIAINLADGPEFDASFGR